GSLWPVPPQAGSLWLREGDTLMMRSRLQRTLAGLATAVVFGLLLLLFGPSPQGESGQQAAPVPRKPRPAGQPISRPPNLVGLEIALGLKDVEPTSWDGEVQISEGRLLEVQITRGNAKAKVDGQRFSVRSFAEAKQKKKGPTAATLRVSLDAPPKA